MNSPNDVAGLRFSPLESARFGLRVFRASMDAIDADALTREIDRERVDVAILRIPARALSTLQPLAERGFSPIVADTLVTYACDLEALARFPDDARIVLRDAAASDGATLASMARAIFAGYSSHYHANPLFDRERILEGYAEWAARHVDAGEAAKAAWLVERDGVLAGFSCYSVDRERGIASAVLNGILPDARGRGVYRAMLRAMLMRFAGLGFTRFEIATQVHNLVVQRVWAASGLVPERAANTVHVNALRGRISG